MSDWKPVELGEVLPLKYGAALRAGDRQPGGVPVYGSSGLVGWSDRALVDRPCLVIGRKGNVGFVYYSPQPCFPIDTTFYTTGSNGFDLRFGYYLLKQQRLGSAARDSAVPGLNRRQYETMIVQIPQTSWEQRAIAEVLGALDDKIAANRNTVALGEETSRSFLELMLTEGGRSMPLSQLAHFVNGRAFTSGASGTGRVVIRIAELNSGIGGSTVHNDIEVPDEHLARPGDLLFAWSGSLTVHRWYRPEAIINQHIFKVVPADGFPIWLVHGALMQKLPGFKAIAADKATTMGHIQRRHLDQPVRIPTPLTVQRYDCLMTVLWDRMLAAEVENLKLGETRDALLPLLMSGRLRVKDAEKFVEDVT